LRGGGSVGGILGGGGGAVFLWGRSARTGAGVQTIVWCPVVLCTCVLPAVGLGAGVEERSVFEGNLAVLVRSSANMLTSDLEASGFWTPTPSIIFRHNVAVACERFGFWVRGSAFTPPPSPNPTPSQPGPCPAPLFFCLVATHALVWRAGGKGGRSPRAPSAALLTAASPVFPAPVRVR
jgi:hypothetical protein